MLITAKQDTWLKKDASKSASEQPTKSAVESGKSYNVKVLSKQLGHTLVSLPAGAGEWFVFDDHWVFKQEPEAPTEIDWNDFSCKVSKYFTVGEVTNNEVRRIPKTDAVKQNVLSLAKELDKVREAWGSALVVTSWYRPPAVNRAIGGARNSRHTFGKAVDIRPAQGDLYAFQKWLDDFWGDKALGYGAKKGFVHIDLRPGRIRWNY